MYEEGWAEDVGQRVRAARLERGLSLGEAARHSHLDASTISRIENGDREPNVTTLLKLAVGLEITVHQLLGDNHQCLWCGTFF